MNNFFEIFDKQVSEYYHTMIQLSNHQIDLISEIKLSDEELKKCADEIFATHFVYPTLEIGDEKKSKQTLELTQKQLKKLFPNDFFLETSHTEIATELSYEITYTGWEDALSYTVNFNKREVRGKLTRTSVIQTQGTIHLVFYVRGLDIDTYGQQIRAQKEELITAIQSNAVAVSGYFESRREEFKDSIVNRLRLKIAANKQYNLELRKF